MENAAVQKPRAFAGRLAFEGEFFGGGVCEVERAMGSEALTRGEPLVRADERAVEESPGRRGSARVDDAEALRRVGRGDMASLGTLAGRHEAVMLGVARGLGGGEEAARDCVQDAWVRVIRGARSYSGSGSVRAWLVRVTVNASRDRGRRAAHRRRLLGIAGLRGSVRGDGGVGEVVDVGLWRAVSRLDIAEREAVVLCHCRGLTHPEAAEALGVAVGTLKTRLYRGLGRLREMLGEDADPGAAAAKEGA